jgi:poly-gamma-glutamate capsule biosynthesis protein CapA/YwtB (metallophosphatase superfamily)
MKWLAWILVPIALGFVVWLLLSAEWESITKPPHAYRTAAVMEAIPVETPVHLLFTGDAMFDRGIALYVEKNGIDSLFVDVKDVFARQDGVIVNLEGVITTNASVSIPNHANLRFTFAPDYLQILKDIGVLAVSLSNNHTDDFGDSGLIETRKFLSNAGIAYFGAPDNADGLSTSLKLKNQTVCLVGYEGFIRSDVAPLVAEILRIRDGCDFLAATMHAGEEYQLTPTLFQQHAARAFIDAGADIVIGTHPHVVQPLEIYKGKPIFYSLGNFMFDQDFSWETEHGIAVAVSIGNASTSVSIIPTAIRYGRASLTDSGIDAERTMGRLGTTTPAFEIR